MAGALPALLLATMVAQPVTAAPAAAAPDAITVTILGSGTPVPSRTQVGPAMLVEAGGERFLFDCGRGCTTRLAQVDPTLIARVDKLFLTHLHSDHVVGVPDLWLNGWTQGRASPLRVWGPAGVRPMMAGLRQAYAADIGYRIADGVPATAAGLVDATRTLDDRGGVVYEAGGVRIIAYRVSHGDVPAYGYRVEHGGNSVMLSGDTSVALGLTQGTRGADVVLLEVASPAMAGYLRRTFAPGQADKVLGLHLTARQAAGVLAAARPSLGVYYHNVGGCAADRDLLAATRAAYSGRVVVARDLIRVRVGRSVAVDETLAGPAPTCPSATSG